MNYYNHYSLPLLLSTPLPLSLARLLPTLLPHGLPLRPGIRNLSGRLALCLSASAHIEGTVK
jgi:hypothetical protein